ncbi:unnamed protein product [Pylaiella littoralis]
MGNVLDCSTDPLDQIHEPNGNQPTEVGPTESDDGRSQSSCQGSAAGGASGHPPRPEVLYLEKGVPLRESIMWKLQREYYTAHHVQCWEKMVVPCFVTSNSFIARAYARVLVGFMRDWFLFSGKADRSEPLLILEVGAGHGKFSCLVLQHLLEMREFLPTLRQENGGVPSEGGAGGARNAGSEVAHEVDAPGRSTTSIAGAGAAAAAAAEVGGTAGAAAGAAAVDDTADAPPAAAVGDKSSATRTEGADEEEAEAEVEAEVSDRQYNETADSRIVRPPRTDDAAAPTAGRAWKGRRAADGLPFRYVVTDVAQGTLDYVRRHPSMQSYLSKGVLEVALLDAEDANPPDELLLQARALLCVSGQAVDLKSLKNPVATVCNYVFDSLRQDAFRVKGETLYENRVTITATKPLPEDLSELSLTALQGLGLRWEHQPYAVPADRARAYYAGVVMTGALLYRTPGSRSTWLTLWWKSPCEQKRHGQDCLGRLFESIQTEGTEDGGAVAEKGVSGEEALPPLARDAGAALEKGVPGEADGGAEGETRSRGGGGGGGGSGGNSSDEAEKCANEGASSAPAGGDGSGGSADGKRDPDSDFDELLGSYLGGGAEDGEGREGSGSGGTFGDGGGSLLMPLGALRLLRHLSSLSGGRGLVLVGDKGYVRGEEMAGERDPHIAYHGSLSCMVNLDALARYAQQRGGWSLSSPYMEGFKCQALAFGMAGGDLQETRFAFEDSTQAFGPESFSTLQRTVKEDVSQPSLGLVVQLLRLSRLDPDVFMKFRASLVDQARRGVSTQDLPPPIWRDLNKDTTAIAQRCYPLQQASGSQHIGKDVNFEAARLLMALKDYEAALALFYRSDSVSGEHHVTCHNMGMSYFYLGKLQQAKECFERSLSLDEASLFTYQDSVRWLAHVEQSMVPPDLAATADASPRASDQRGSVAGGTGGTADSNDRSKKTSLGSEDVNLNKLSI